MTDFPERSAFSDVDGSRLPSYLIAYLDAARRAPGIIETKRWILDQLGLARGHRALDVGCGTGEDVVTMADAVGPSGSAVGIDSSTSMIEEARRRHCETPNVAFSVVDAHTLPFDDASFDGARSERTLQHVRDPARVVAEMARVLRPGGRLAVSDPDWETLVVAGSEPQLTRTMVGHHISRHHQPTIGRRLSGLLVESGFVDLQLSAGVVIFTDLETVNRAMNLAPSVQRLGTSGVVPENDVVRWLLDLEQADVHGTFFCAVTTFRVAGSKAAP